MFLISSMELLLWNKPLTLVICYEIFRLVLLLRRVDLVLRIDYIVASIRKIWVICHVVVITLVVVTLVLNITDFSQLIILPLLDLEYFIFRGEVNMLLLPLEDFV